MMKFRFIILAIIISSLTTRAQSKSNIECLEMTEEAVSITNISGKTIVSRFNCPSNYQRIEYGATSFGTYLRNLPLKEDGSFVELYNGYLKTNRSIYDAVVDLKIGNKDLHQCADAIIRLRAEYLWKEKRYNEIHFNLTNGFRVDYSEWIKGKRVAVEGNKTYWVSKKKSSNTYKDLWNYLEFIFTYAGTLSLSKELISVPIEEVRIGDIFIKGGSPGHAILVVDMAENKKTGEMIFMIAQSYMPAQQIQILSNNKEKDKSPWYSTKVRDYLETPEWTFKSTDLKRFE